MEGKLSGLGVHKLTKRFPPKPLQRMRHAGIGMKGGNRLILSGGESARWLTSWLMKLAGPKRSPHCDPEA